VFERDLRRGESVENYALNIYKEEFPTMHKQEGYNPEFDLIDDNGYCVEVKFDKESEATNNIAIEIRCNSRPSGISKTRATEWLHFFYHHNKLAYSRIKPHDLKAFIRNNKEFLRIINGGDGNRAQLVLIPVYDFMDNFTYRDIT
jgi:hypothetical protein